jgi:AcrR family transcriptional regulator
VSRKVNRPKRGYHSPRRQEQGAATRRAVLEQARRLFVERGYAKTTVAEIAQAAGVAVDTVYATVGRKPVLLRELVETSISGTDDTVPAAQRDYVQAIRAAPSVEEKFGIYAEAVTAIQQRLAPIFLALRDAAASDASCAELWAEISRRRARNMREFAADLRRTGRLRADLSDDQVADVVWSMNSAEYWALLVGERGWPPDQFRDWLIDAWSRMLLNPARDDTADPGGGSSASAPG